MDSGNNEQGRGAFDLGIASQPGRAALKARAQQKEYRASLEQITLLMSGSRTANGDMVDVDPLFAACSVVGRAAGITFRKPFAELQNSHEEPLQLICRFSGVRTRMVALRKSERWWLSDNGPILCCSALDSRPMSLLPDSSGYRMFDPSTAKTVNVTASVAEELAEKAWMFYRPLPDKPLKGKELLAFGLQGSRSDLLRLFLLGSGGAMLGLLTPVLTGMLFGSVIPHSDRGQLLQLSLILIASVISVSGFNLARQVALIRMETDKNKVNM